MSNYKAILNIIFLLGLSASLFGQVDSIQIKKANQLLEQAKALSDQGKYELSLITISRSMNSFEALGAWELYVKAAGFKANNYAQLGDFDKVEQINKASIAMIKEKNLSNTLLSHTYFLSGVLNYEKGFYHKSLSNFQASIENLKQGKAIASVDGVVFQDETHQNSMNQNLGHAYNYAAFAAIGLGDFHKSLSYFKKAKQYYELAKDIPSTFNSYINIGTAYLLQGDFEAAIRSFEKVPQALEKHPKAAPMLTIAYNNLSNVYRIQENFEQEKKYIDQLKILFTNPEMDQIKSKSGISLTTAWCIVQSKEALNLAQLNRREEAKKIAQEAFESAKNIRTDTEELLAAYEFIGRTFHLLDLKESALVAYQHGLSLADPNLNRSAYFEQAVSTDIIYKLSGLKLLEGKARVLQSISKEHSDLEKIKWLESALTATEVGVQIANTLQLNLVQVAMDKISTEGSLLSLEQRFVRLFDLNIELATKLYQATGERQYLEKAFQVSEESKAFILKQALDKVETYKGLPVDKRKQLQELEAELFFFEKQIFEATNKENLPLKEKLERKRDDLKEVYQKIISELKNNPETAKYYKERYGFREAPVREIQLQLTQNPEKAIVEIYEAADKIYTFFITADTSLIHKVNKPEDWDIMIKQLANINVDLNLIADSILIRKYSDINQSLYQILFNGILEEQGNQIERLVIIPHGSTHDINFSLLLESPAQPIFYTLPYVDYPIADCSDFDYLLKKYAISYHHSSSIFLDDLEKARKKKSYDYKLLGFAPDYSYRNQTADQYMDFKLSLLPDELGSLLPLFNTDEVKIIKGQEASELGFRKAIQQYSASILHISAHGKVKRENALFSRILLSRNPDDKDRYDDNLEVGELYNLYINTQLAILSACETGVGTIIGGEGKINLARGFAYANCPGIIMSLWKLEIGANQKIMEQLYTELISKHNTVDQALQAAQVQYLQDQKLAWQNGQELSSEKQKEILTSLHPFFWGGLVPVGRVEAL